MIILILGIALITSACGNNVSRNITTSTKVATTSGQMKQDTGINSTENTKSDNKQENTNEQQQATGQRPNEGVKQSVNEIEDHSVENAEEPVYIDETDQGTSMPKNEDKANYKATICIDPGHQIPVDNSTEPVAPGSGEMKVKNPGGAAGISTGIPEYEVNLKISKFLKELLEKNGYNVVMTHESNDVNISNIERAEIANKANADLFVRIHADSAANSSAHGVSILIPGDMYIKDEEILSKSRQAAGYILDSVVNETGAYSRGLIVSNDMTGFNWCKVPMLLIETGFLSNPEEEKKLSDEKYQRTIANGIFKGIEKYFSNNF